MLVLERETFRIKSVAAYRSRRVLHCLFSILIVQTFVSSSDVHSMNYKLYGDIDGNGKVNLVDVVKMLLLIRNGRALTFEEQVVADVNIDGLVDRDDIQQMLKSSFQGQGVFSTISATPQILAEINAEIAPGTLVLLENGTYTTPIAPASSGTRKQPITYRPAENARPLFKKVNPAIQMTEKSFILIDGMKFLDCPRFMNIESSSHITIQNCDFENGLEWESSRLKDMGDHFLFKNNSLKNGTDLLTIQGGSFHLIEGNTFNTASHTCMVFMGVHNSVIRNNRLINPIQKLLEIFATREREWTGPYRKSEHILIENNLFGPNGHGEIYQGKEPPASWSIQFAGVQCIIRNNIFAGCDGGLDITGYGEIGGAEDSPEAVFNNGNRTYNNTIYSNGRKGRYGSGPGILLSHNEHTEFFDNLFVNNILYANRIFQDAHTSRDVPTVQIAFRSPAIPSETGFFYNDIMAMDGQDKTVVWFKLKDEGDTLNSYEASFPDFSGSNIQADPLFVIDEPDLTSFSREEFVLKQASPCVDAGGFLTYAVSAGTGTTINVKDPYFFSDGFGIVEGDIIRIGAEEVQVTTVDYKNGQLTISKPIQWSDNAPISLTYKGKAPDIGAIESY